MRGGKNGKSKTSFSTEAEAKLLANNAAFPLHSKHSTQVVFHVVMPLLALFNHLDSTSRTKWTRCSSICSPVSYFGIDLTSLGPSGEVVLKLVCGAGHKTLKLCSGKAIKRSGSQANTAECGLPVWLGIGICEPNCQTTLYLKCQSDWWSSSVEGHK